MISQDRRFKRDMDHRSFARTTGCMIVIAVIMFLVFFRLVSNLPLLVKLVAERTAEIVTSNRPVAPIFSSTTSEQIEQTEEESQ